MDHAANLFDGFSAERHFAAVDANVGRDIFHQDKFAVNPKNLTG